MKPQIRKGSAVFVFPGCCLWPRWCSGRRRPRPPARLGALTSFGAAPRSPPVPSGPSGTLHTGGAVSLTCACASARCPARPRHCPLISHVIPLRLVQSLNLHRWNCNVFGVSRKMTTINYVRNLGGGGAWSLMCYWVRCFEARPGPVPRRVPHPQFRMQFPDTCSSSLSEKPGISTITFQSMKCAWGNCMRMCADRAPPPPTSTAAWSLYSLWASRGSRVLSFWGALVRVVTNVVNPRAFSLKMVVFGLRLTTFVTSAAHWSPGQAPPPPMGGAAWPCRPGGPV